MASLPVVSTSQPCYNRLHFQGRIGNMNRYLTYQDGELLFEDVALNEIAEEMYTPFYAYSKAAILEKVEAFKQAFADIKPMMAFSLRAQDTKLITDIMIERGCSLEVSNIHEMQRAIANGYKSTSIIFNSFGLPEHEISAVLKQRPLIINVGNIFDLEPLNRFAAEMDTGVRIGLRINLGIETGAFFGTNVGAADSRIGIQRKDLDLALALVSKLPQINLVGVSCRVGTQIAQLAPWIKMSEEMAKIYTDIKDAGHSLEYLDLGGGFPVAYKDMDYIEIKKIARNIIPHVKDLDCRLILEPGRYFVAEAGVLVTSVLGVKDVDSKFYVITDAGFAEFPRPALYRIQHEIVHVKEPVSCDTEPGGAFAMAEPSGEPMDVATGAQDPGEYLGTLELPTDFMHAYESAGQFGTARPPGEPITADIVGPGEEGLDYLARDMTMCVPKRGELLAVLNAGAYCRTMSSNYQSRPRPPEILIERDKFEIIRSREVVDDLISLDMEESEIEA